MARARAAAATPRGPGFEGTHRKIKQQISSRTDLTYDGFEFSVGGSMKDFKWKRVYLLKGWAEGGLLGLPKVTRKKSYQTELFSREVPQPSV